VLSARTQAQDEGKTRVEADASVKQAFSEETAATTISKMPQLANDNKWLYAQPADHYTIQLISVNTKAQAASFVDKFKLKEAGYFATRKNKVDWYYVIKGIYPTRSAAAEAVRKLPLESVQIRKFGRLQASRCKNSVHLPQSFAGDLKPHCLK
jgi:septal ring-binding cell division protein DamX